MSIQITEPTHYWPHTSYKGTYEDLQAANLIPPGTPRPGEVPGKHGVRWLGLDGRKHVLTKDCNGRKGVFRLRVALTPQERTQLEQEHATAQKRKAIDEQLTKLNISEREWREHALQWVQTIFCWLCGPPAHLKDGVAMKCEAFSFDPLTRGELLELRAEMLELVRDGKLRRNTSQIEALQRQLAAVNDGGLQSFLARVVA
jgi:hypothetical protein